MNQTSQYIFNLYHYLLNLRDTLEYTINREHTKVLYDQRKMVLTKGIEKGSALGNFLDNNPDTGNKIREKLNEFINEIYADDSSILTVTGETVRVDYTQNIKILDYVVGISESIRDIIHGYLNFAKSKNELEPEIEKLVYADDRLYRDVLAMLALTEYQKSFGEFQKVMNESQGKPTPQSNFIVQNEISKIAGFIRFSREHHRIIDNETLDVLDNVNALVEMTEGRRERRDNKPFNDLFKEVTDKVKANVAKAEAEWKPQFEACFKNFIDTTKAQAEANKDAIKA